jgi:hypothetical protein
MGQKRNDKFDILYDEYLTGYSLQKIAERNNVTRQCLYKAFKLRGYKLRGPNFNPVQYFDGIKFTLRCNGYYSMTTGNRMLMHRYVWENSNGKIPNGYDIHHKNFDKSDNRLENLECLPKSEHTRLYSPRHNQYTKNKNYAPH